MSGIVPTRVLIVKLSSLGDIVHALPVPGALRARLPEVRIAWAVEKKWLPLVERHPDLDAVFPVDSQGLRRNPLRWHELRRQLAPLRAFAPHWALDLQGTVKSAVATRASGAPWRVGFAPPALRERLAGLAYNLHVEPRSTHVVEQMLELAAAVEPRTGAPAAPAPTFPIPIPEPVQADVDSWLRDNRLGEFAFFSPGGGWAAKRWPSERYARLAEMLEQRHGWAVVLNRGPGERDMDDAYRRANQIRARLFSGDVEHLAAVLRRARVVIGGDTGPLQLAAALGTPTVALFGPTDPARNGPYSPVSQVIRKTESTTYKRGAAYSPAMLAITPEEVAAVCDHLGARQYISPA